MDVPTAAVQVQVDGPGERRENELPGGRRLPSARVVKQVVVDSVAPVVRPVPLTLFLHGHAPIVSRRRFDDAAVGRHQIHVMTIVVCELAVVAHVHGQPIARAVVNVVVSQPAAGAAVHVDSATTIVDASPAEVPEIAIVNDVVSDPLVIGTGADDADGVALSLRDVAAPHLAAVSVVAEVDADIAVTQVAPGNDTAFGAGHDNAPATKVAQVHSLDADVLHPLVLIRFSPQCESGSQGRHDHLVLAVGIAFGRPEKERLRVRIDAPFARRVEFFE